MACWTHLDDKENLNQFDAVINLAGEPIADKRWTPEQKQTLVNSRCKLTQKLVDLIKSQRLSPSVLISGSAVGFMVIKVKIMSLKRRHLRMNLLINSVPNGKILHSMHKRH